MILNRPIVVLVVVACFAGCASTRSNTPTIADLRDVARARGIPKIIQVVDLGVMRLPKKGGFAVPTGDGTATIGELLLIWGKDFGKQPAVTIGSQPSTVLRHVSGGGIVVRVPWGIAAGTVPITIGTLKGKTTRTFPVRRVGVVGDEKGVTFFSLGAGSTLEKIGQVASAPVRALSLSDNTATAYAVVADKKKLELVTYDLTASVPKRLTSDPLPGTRLIGFARARRTHLSVALTDTHLVYIDTRHAKTPALYRPHRIPLPLRSRSFKKVALSPDGATLAVLADDRNELLLFDSHIPAKLPAAKAVPLMPDARVPLVADLAFTLDGRSVWVIAGDSKASLASGHRPLMLLNQPVAHATPNGEATRWVLDDARAAVQLIISRSAPTPEGTAIREKTAASAGYVASVPSTWIAGKVAAATGGRVLRSDVEKTITTLLDENIIPVSLAIGGRPQDVVVLAATSSGAAQQSPKKATTQPSAKDKKTQKGAPKRESKPGLQKATRVLIAYPAWTEGKSGRLELGPLSDPNAPIGQVLLQP
jgi:hypothetical protein